MTLSHESPHRRLILFLRYATFVSFGLMLVFLPFRIRAVLVERYIEPLYIDYTSFLFGPSDALVLITLALWSVTLVLERRKPAIGPRLLAYPVAAMIVVALVGVSFSADPALAFYNVVRLAALSGIALYALNEITRLAFIAFPVAAQIFIQALVAIGEFLAQRSISLEWLGERTLNPTESTISIVSIDGVRWLRAYGLTDHPNLLGGCLAFALVVLATWYLATSSRWRVPAIAVLGIGSLALLFSYSRSAWLAVGAAVVFIAFLLWRTRKRRVLADLALLSVAIALVVTPFFIQRASLIGVRLNVDESFGSVQDEARSINERGTLNAAANELFIRHALIGTGLNTSPIAMRQAFPDFEYNYQPPHIVLLAAAVETGLFGAMIYGVIMIAPWTALLIRRKALHWSPDLIGLSGAVIAVTVVGFFDYYTWMWSPGRLWLFVLWGLWAGTYVRSLPEKK